MFGLDGPQWTLILNGTHKNWSLFIWSYIAHVSELNLDCLIDAAVGCFTIKLKYVQIPVAIFPDKAR